jgi:hypothetical protein
VHNFICGSGIAEMRDVTARRDRKRPEETMFKWSGISKGSALCCALSLVLVASTAQTPAPPDVPASLARDRHEGVTLSADAYSDPARCKEKFGKANPYPGGILPVEIFLRNETSQPVKIDLSTVQMTVHHTTGAPQNLDWLSVKEVAAAVAYPKGPKAPHASRLPLGIPTGEDKKVDSLVAVLQPFAFDGDVLPPQSLLHGFLFFDVDHDFSVVQKSSLYLPDATTIPGNKALLFFEVPLSGGALRQ